MNKIHKVLKNGQAVGENAKGVSGNFVKFFRKLALATAVATIGLTSAQATNNIDSAYNVQVIGGDNNTVGGTVPSSMTTSTSLTTIAGYQNTMNSSNSSQITGNGNVLTNSDAPVLGESNFLTGVYGTVVGDVNTIVTTAKPTSTNDDRKLVFVYGSGNNATDISSGTIVGQQNKITADTSSTSPINYGSGANVIGFNSGRVFGDNNTLTNVAGSSIVGQDNKLKDADMTVLGDGNTAIHQYGYISGDNNTATQYNPNDIGSTQYTAIYGGGNKVTGTTNGEMINVSGTNNTLTDNKQIQALGSNNVFKSVTYSNIIGSSNTATSVQGANVLGSGATVTAQNSVTLGNGSTNNRDNTVSIGTAGAERQVTNVGAGTQDTDAVNVSQLTTAITDAGTQAKAYADAQNAIVATKANQSDLNTTNQTVSDLGNTVASNQTANDTKNAQQDVIIDSKANQSDLNATNQTVSTNTQAITDNKATADAQNTATNGRIDNTNAIVATKANQSDLNTTNQTVSDLGNTVASNQTANDTKNAQQDVIIDSKANQSDLNATNQTVSDNAVASQNRDNVLQTQVTKMGANTTAIINNVVEKQAVVDARQDVHIKNLGERVGEMNKNLSGGIAGATALAMMPTASEPDARMLSFGSGFFNGESAIAVGYTGTSDNGKWSFKTGISFNSASEPTYGLGAGYRFR